MILSTPEAFRAAVAARLTLDVSRHEAPTVRSNGDHLLDPGAHSMADEASAKPAAVLIPVVARDEATVLLTERSAHLPSHAGQIAFPGGKIDPTDRDPIETALREAEEEIGLDRRHVRPIGLLEPFLTRTGYRVAPVVALVEPHFTLSLNHGEVADAFEVPLAFLMDPANHQTHSRLWQGRQRSYFAMPYGDRYIWGVTAGILRDLWERLNQPAPGGP